MCQIAVTGKEMRKTNERHRGSEVKVFRCCIRIINRCGGRLGLIIDELGVIVEL